MPSHTTNICSRYHGRDLLVSSQLGFLKTSGIVKQSKPHWIVSHSHCSHPCQLPEVLFRAFVGLFALCLRTKDKPHDLTYIWSPPPSKHMHTPLSPAIPGSERRQWQRRVVSPYVSGRQVHFISVCPSVQLAFLRWPTTLTLSAALTSNMPF